MPKQILIRLTWNGTQESAFLTITSVDFFYIVIHEQDLEKTNGNVVYPYTYWDVP